MEQKITIRDVAEKAGVSISSVHIALNGKKGVSEETRVRIQKIADEMGYHPNTMASALKRKEQHVAILLPNESDNNRYYYPPVWNGIRDYEATNQGNVVYQNIPIMENNFEKEFEAVKSAICNHELDGLLTAGHLKEIGNIGLDADDVCDIPIVFISSAPKGSHYLCCVQSDYEVIGRTMAEIISSQIEPYGSIFLCAGNPNWTPHAGIVHGFDNFMAENHRKNPIYKDYSYSIGEENYIHITRSVMRPDVAACASVFAQGTVLLGRAIEETRKKDEIFAVGSDLTSETINWLKTGVFDAIMQKNPYAQGYLGLKTLVDYLYKGQEPAKKDISVGSEIVLRSNLSMYEHGQYFMPLV